MDRLIDPARVDWRAVLGRIGKPRRPHAEEVRAALLEIRREATPRGADRGAAALTRRWNNPEVLAEAWEVLTGRLGLESELSRPDRIFLPHVPLQAIHYDSTRWPSLEDAPAAFANAPTSLDAIEAFLSVDFEEVRRVESIALEVSRCMKPWGAIPSRRVAWLLVTAGWIVPYWTNILGWPTLAAAWAADQFNLASAQVDSAEAGLGGRYQGLIRTWASDIRYQVRNYAKDWIWWEECVRSDLRVPDPAGLEWAYPASMRGMRFRDLPNPLTPTLAIYELGYLLVDLRGDVAVLGVMNEGSPVGAPSWTALRKQQAERFKRRP